VGTSSGFAAGEPTVCARGVGVLPVAGVPAPDAVVGDPGRLVAVLVLDDPPQAAMIADSVVALVPTATRRKNVRRSRPLLCHFSYRAPKRSTRFMLGPSPG